MIGRKFVLVFTLLVASFFFISNIVDYRSFGDTTHRKLWGNDFSLPNIAVATDDASRAVTGDVCAPLEKVLKRYKKNVVDKAKKFDGEGNSASQRNNKFDLSDNGIVDALWWKCPRQMKSGLGSSLKGLVNMFFLAVLRGVPLLVDHNGPALQDFYESDYVFFPTRMCYNEDPLKLGCKTPKMGSAMSGWSWCFNWGAQLSNPDFKVEKLWSSSSTNIMPLDVPTFCDRHLFHLFLRNKDIKKKFLEPNGLSGLTPWQMSGCLFRLMMKPKAKFQKTVNEALLVQQQSDGAAASGSGGSPAIAAHAASVSSSSSSFPALSCASRRISSSETRGTRHQQIMANSPPLIGVQLRIGGSAARPKGIVWDDPDRIRPASRKAMIDCSAKLVKTTMRRVAAVCGGAGGGGVDHPSVYYSVFVTGDDRESYDAIASVVPTGRLVGNGTAVFWHNTRSELQQMQQAADTTTKKEEAVATATISSTVQHHTVAELDAKTVLDFEILCQSDVVLSSRSAFGELAAHVSAVRGSKIQDALLRDETQRQIKRKHYASHARRRVSGGGGGGGGGGDATTSAGVMNQSTSGGGGGNNNHNSRPYGTDDVLLFRRDFVAISVFGHCPNVAAADANERKYDAFSERYLRGEIADKYLSSKQAKQFGLL